MHLGDLSVLDQLKALRAQIETLDGRLTAMEEKRGQVADQVYVRVRSDYAAQREQLIAKSAPLKLQARELYGQLQSNLGKLEEAFEEHRLATEELELRHTLGEFDTTEFEQRKQNIADQLGSKRSERESALDMRGQFIDAFGSERELEGVPATPAPEATMVIAPAPVVAPQIVRPDITGPMPPIPNPPSALPDEGNETAVFAPTAPTPAAAIPSAMPPPPTAGPLKRGNPDGTLVFRPGRLLPANAEAGMVPTTLSLKPIAIGSDNSCDIRLSLAGIGRRHVEITMSRAGFNLKDVAGGNLVTVNGEIVTERILEDGDLIGVAQAQFQFKRG
jgi:hypothetical protein